MASETLVKPKLKATVRASAITRDGVQVLIEAHGPGTSWLERRKARRNAARWNKGLRPNRIGLWR